MNATIDEVTNSIGNSEDAEAARIGATTFAGPDSADSIEGLGRLVSMVSPR
jgi:hypothetical protein